MDLGERIKLIVDQRETLKKAKADYDQAHLDLLQARSSDEHSPEGTLAVTKATQRERQTFNIYRLAQWSFDRLILDGKLPDERNSAMGTQNTMKADNEEKTTLNTPKKSAAGR